MTKDEYLAWLEQAKSCIKQLRAENAPRHEIDRWVRERDFCLERLASMQ